MKMNLFWKIYISILVSFMVIVLSISYVISVRQVAQIEKDELEGNKILVDLISKEIEVRYYENKWPFESLNRLSKSEATLFWWVVRDNDGLIYIADKTSFMGTHVHDHYPQIVGIAGKEYQFLDRKQNYAILVKHLDTGQTRWSFWYGISLKEVTKRKKDVILLISVVSISAIAMIGIILFFAIKHFTKPIKGLIDGTTIIGSGNLAHRIKIESEDELGLLAKFFNRMAEDLQENTVSKEHMYNVIGSMLDTLMVLDSDININKVNKMTCDLLKYSAEELIGRPLEMIFFTNRKVPFQRFELIRSLTGDHVKSYEGYFQAKDGTTIPVLFNSSVIRDESGNVECIVCTANDITERKRAEESLRESEEKYRSVFDNATVGINLKLPGGTFLEANQSLINTLGYSREELNNLSFLDITHPDDVQISGEKHDSLKRGDIDTYRIEKRYLGKNGRVIWVDTSVRALRDSLGKLRATVGVIADITERKQIEVALKESEERFKQLAEVFPETIFESDLEGNMTYANRHAYERFGYTEEDFSNGLNLMSMVAPEDRHRVMARIRERIEGKTGGYLEYQALRKDGVIFPALGHSVAIIRNGRPIGLRGFILNITERKRAEEKLHLQELQLRTILDSTGDGILAVDNAGRVIKANSRFAYLWTIPSDLLKEGSDEALLTYVLDQLDDPDAFLEKVHALYKSSEEDFDMILFKDGRVMERYSSPLLNEGVINGRVWSFRDITERKRAEEKLQASLREKETLLKEIHHRVKNNLQVISSLLSLQSQHTKNKGDLEMFRASENRVRTMALVHNMLYQSETLSAIDYGSFIRELVGVLLHAYHTDPSAIKINLDVHDIQLDIVRAVPCGLILNELISNTLKHAFPGDAKGEISLRMRAEGDRIVMRLQDTGVGFPEALDFRNIRSLGLQLVNILVEQMNGTIELMANGGTTFIITFPITSMNKG